MELSDLIGEHTLTAVELGVEKATAIYEEDANTIAFTLDGVTYLAKEDGNDGYRSYCDELEIVDMELKNKFPSQKVVGVMMKNSSHQTNDVIQFLNPDTNAVILEVGTENTDDYYPSCVMSFNPENMSINLKN